jgi:hypothetical protein
MLLQDFVDAAGSAEGDLGDVGTARCGQCAKVELAAARARAPPDVHAVEGEDVEVRVEPAGRVNALDGHLRGIDDEDVAALFERANRCKVKQVLVVLGLRCIHDDRTLLSIEPAPLASVFFYEERLDAAVDGASNDRLEA